MQEQIKEALIKITKTLFNLSVNVDLTRPDEQYGEYATNIALQLAGKLGQPPTEVANKIANSLTQELSKTVEEISVVNNFINIRLKSESIWKIAQKAPGYHPTSYKGKVVVTEYSDPNPFKVLHVGHLYTSVVGEAISNLLEMAGANVHRVNFGGDVGLHVAKTLWSVIDSVTEGQLNNLGIAVAEVNKQAKKTLDERANWLAENYVRGSQKYLDGTQEEKDYIVKLNKQIYVLHSDDDHKSELAQIYWTTRQWSYDYFEAFYKQIQIHPFEKYYPESQVATIGLKTVQEELAKGVYQESDGAVVFSGEKYGLHTRVFINSAGLPTYEAKDVGLIMLKWQDYHFNKSVIITGNEQSEYMKVVQKSLEQYKPELVKASVHLTHGIVKLKGGVKMSSRKGNIIRATDVLDATASASQELVGEHNMSTNLGAIKYALLKSRLGIDIIYDPSESVSLVGNSGPYLQYAHARARSILTKITPNPTVKADSLEPQERSLARKIGEFPEVIDHCISELLPHHICVYLYELAQVFNSFYENNRVVDDPRQDIRGELVKLYAETLKVGLQILSIDAPNKI